MALPSLKRRRLLPSLLTALVLCAGIAASAVAAHASGESAGALAAFDFTQADEVARWRPVHHVGPLSATPDGMVIPVTGDDPHLIGPPVDLPEGADLWLLIRLRSEAGGPGEIFYCPRGQGPSGERKVPFAVPAGRWVERRVPLPALGPATRFRLDPPGGSGQAVVAWMRLERRMDIPPPEWPKPAPPALGPDARTVRSGPLVVRYAPGAPGRFAVEVAGTPMAAGLAESHIGYVHEGTVRWIPWRDGVRDPDGAVWRIAQTFTAGRDGTIDVAVRLSVDRPRDVVFLPALVLLPGAGSFGAAKKQAVLAGLEYLADEPSSSEADIRGPESRRQAPDRAKITFPLMAVAAGGRYVGLAWTPEERAAAVFDSPDRLFGSGGHVMGLVAPGSDGENRAPGSLVPRWPDRLEADTPILLHATIIGGEGDTVIAAVGQYVALRGLPPLPDTGLDAQGYVRLAAAGWLDSKIREGNRYRHAFWENWNPHPAADAGVWLRQLASAASDAALSKRLDEAARGAIGEVPPGQYFASAVGHVRPPAAPLVFGHVAESLDVARRTAESRIGRFDAQGRVLYQQARDKPDYAATHWSRESSGLAGRAAHEAIAAAVYAGDADLVRRAVGCVRALDRFAGTVPRGGQTWEVPLHTPDILASAHLVAAYTLAFEATGEPHFLQEARYWAWTGVPFVYLVNPTDGPVGVYSTIAVYGATNWQAPVWFGRPVQWCGLVYADALYRLGRHDSEGPWRRLADGIAAAGVQHTWKQNDANRQGLLPDWFAPREQVRAGPAINPGTVQASAARLYGLPPVYDYAVCRKAGLYVHAPGRVEVTDESATAVAFRVSGWPAGPYWVLVSGFGAGRAQPPTVRINGAAVEVGMRGAVANADAARRVGASPEGSRRAPAAAGDDAAGQGDTTPHEYVDSGALILRLEGDGRVEVGP